MSHFARMSGIISAAFIISPCFTTAATPNHGTVHAVTRSHYSKAHSLGDTYEFDPRDGWQGANVTNLQYKYRRELNDVNVSEGSLEKRGKKKGKGKPGKKGDKNSDISGSIKHALNGVWNGLKGIGKSQEATITWCVITVCKHYDSDIHSQGIPDMTSRIRAAGRRAYGLLPFVLSL
jgi:hypothetical protein